MSGYIGRALPRLEDLRLVTGNGRYTDDIAYANACFAYVLRSPHAHALIKAIDAEEAAKLPGVLAVLTAADYVADGNRPIPHAANPPDAIDVGQPSFVAADSRILFEHPQPPLAQDRVRYVGEAVALVVAETLEQARDAAELVDVDYETLPAVVMAVDAMNEGAPQLWPEAPLNVALDVELGNRAAVDEGFGAAEFVIEHDFYNQRVVGCQMEPRAATGLYDSANGSVTLVAGSQGVVRQRMGLAAALGLDREKVRVVCPDVGGGFGPRTSLAPEAVLVVWAAKRLGRPVRWTSDRSEAFLSDYQGRDQLSRLALAFDAEGRILAMRATHYGNLGAYPASFAPLANGYRVVSTVYDVPAAVVQMYGVLTNTTPTTPYRGAGRPESTFAIERLLDMAAARLGIDRIELRRRNIISRSRLPYRNVMGLVYDSGDFLGNMERALLRADWDGLPARRTESRANGRLRGIGVSNYVEAPVGAARERLQIDVRPGGRIEIRAGTQASGQGHETSFAQVVADRLNVDIQAVTLCTGDTQFVEVGGGTHSDRSMRLVATLLCEACESLLAQGRELAAGYLDCAADQVGYRHGRFSDGGDKALSLFDLAALQLDGKPLSAVAEIGHRLPAHPTGCAVCELEIDPDTGVVQVLRYTSVDDVGQAINPLIVDGQVHGGIAQGVGQALYESVAFDPDSGQVMSGSFMDYCLPRADDLPSFDVELTEDPTEGNPLRVKGAGEGGITPATAAVINAVVDALREFGVAHIEMPATSQRVWAAIQSARSGSSSPP